MELELTDYEKAMLRMASKQVTLLAIMAQNIIVESSLPKDAKLSGMTATIQVMKVHEQQVEELDL